LVLQPPPDAFSERNLCKSAKSVDDHVLPMCSLCLCGETRFQLLLQRSRLLEEAHLHPGNQTDQWQQDNSLRYAVTRL
jgi:hypothetical protein